MNTAGVKRILLLVFGVLVAFFAGSIVADAVTALAGLGGAAGWIVNIIVYAVVFFFVLGLLEKYAGIVFFGFGKE